MFETNVWIYLWDLVDEGIDEVLDRLKGEAGATGISVATRYHSIEMLRPHPDVSPRTFHSVAGAQFQPDTALYAGTRMRPTPAPWLKKGNPLATLGEACQKRGMKLRGWTVCCHGSATVSKFPHAAVKDVFGDGKSNWMCPINPDVREFIRTMVEDLTQHYPFDAIELERPSFDAAPHSHAHQKIGPDLGQVGKWLYNVCFCESCRQLAKRDGLDVEAAAGVVREALERVFTRDEPIPGTPAEFVAERPALSDYVDWRCGQVTSLVEAVKQSCPCRMVVHRVGDRFLAATDWKAIGKVSDGLLHQCPYPDRDGAMQAIVREVYDDVGDMGGVELGFNLCTPPCPGAEAFVSAVSQAARMKVGSIDVYNYGMLPLPRLEWIRRAARYAQREAEGAAG